MSYSGAPPATAYATERSGSSNALRSPRRSRSPPRRSPERSRHDYRARSPSPRGYQRYSGSGGGHYDDRRGDRYGGGGYHDRGGYGRRRSPPRKRQEVLRGSETDRQFSTCLYVGNLPYSYREGE
ncbi:hypothetical protein HK096_008934, partial [Nowakowskiella sp. JEL0078]